MLRISCICTLTALLTVGCSWVALSPAAETVAVVTPGQVEGCSKIGETVASVRDRVAAVQRRPGKVGEELDRLARNEAARLGGDRVVALGPVTDGDRAYAVYECRPD